MAMALFTNFVYYIFSLFQPKTGEDTRATEFMDVFETECAIALSVSHLPNQSVSSRHLLVSARPYGEDCGRLRCKCLHAIVRVFYFFSII